MRKLVFRNDGGLPEYPPEHLRLIALTAGEDELEAVQRYLSGDPSLRTYLGVVDVPDEFSNKRSFAMPGSAFSIPMRNAWRWDGGNVTVDAPRLRAEYLKSLRLERSLRLDASDKDKQRLDDVGTAEQKAALAAYRQQLRDLPATVAADLDKLDDVAALEQYAPTWPVKPA